jgi:DnaB-like helicase N terminal domain
VGDQRADQGTLPYEREAERNILGSILLDGNVPNRALTNTSELLESTDFLLSQHRLIFACMLRLSGKQEPINYVTLTDGLAQKNELDAAGGVAYLSSLVDGLPRSSHIEHYARIVRRRSLLRRIMFEAEELQLQASRDSEDPACIGTRAVQALNNIVEEFQEQGQHKSVDVLKVADMPEGVLDGRLGEICQQQLVGSGCPIAYAWPAILAVAGTLTPPTSVRSNLYVTLVGPIGSSKSVTIHRALSVLGVKEPVLQKQMAGSAEGLAARLADANGSPRLLFVDEVGHLMSKAKIDNASFPYILNVAYYSTEFDLTIARGKQIHFNCQLGFIGGVVQETFHHAFGSATIGGLHDRVVFGLCPYPFEFFYRPFEAPIEEIQPSTIRVGSDVWEARDEWLKTIPGLTGRHAEHALRTAVIAASFSGKNELSAKDLVPARAFAEYQARVRGLLKPNPGQNPDAVCAFAIMATLEESNDWIDERALSRKIHADRFGPTVFRRCLENLDFNGEIERRKSGRRKQVRRFH